MLPPPTAIATFTTWSTHGTWLPGDARGWFKNTIQDHCAKRQWLLHACNCRTNHIHIVVTASGYDIEIPREQFKTWCTRKLKPQNPSIKRENWWTQRGWDEYIDDVESLETVISYVRDAQDHKNR